MFSVKKDEYVNKTFRIPKKLFDRLYDVAKDQDTSLNKLVIQCCEYTLDNLEESDKE